MTTKAFITKVRVSPTVDKGVTMVLAVEGKIPVDLFWRNRLTDGDIKLVPKPKRRKGPVAEIETKNKKGG